MTGIEIALALIQNFEGCKLHAYQLEGESWLTIGFGHTLPLSEHDLWISQEEANTFLNNDLSAFNSELQHQLGLVYNTLTPNELGATLSFKFNCVPSLFANSTFLRMLKQERMSMAKEQLRLWVHGEQGTVLPGLVRRRKCEAFIFGGGTIEELDALNWFL